MQKIIMGTSKSINSSDGGSLAALCRIELELVNSDEQVLDGWLEYLHDTCHEAVKAELARLNSNQEQLNSQTKSCFEGD